MQIRPLEAFQDLFWSEGIVIYLPLDHDGHFFLELHSLLGFWGLSLATYTKKAPMASSMDAGISQIKKICKKLGSFILYPTRSLEEAASER
jgi:hypothetical protein